MMRESQVLVFGDQSQTTIGGLRELLLLTDNALLSSYFEKAYTTLREEVARSPQDVGWLPLFTSIDTLVAQYAESETSSPAIESSLANIYQTASVLKRLGDSADSSSYPDPDTTRLVGSCTGLLTAASVSCARNQLELVAVSIEVLRVAFRVGVQVASIRDLFDASSNPRASWSTIFAGVNKETATAALADFYRNSDISLTSRAYVSASSANSVTICSDPRSYRSLLDSGIFNKSRPISLPIYGPYHASHLHSNEAIASILSTIPETSSWTPRIPIIANGEEQTYQAVTFHQLMEQTIQDILQNHLDWEVICGNAVASVTALNSEQCRVVSLGGNNGGKSLVDAFAKHKSDTTPFLDDKTATTPQPSEPMGRLRRSKLAIVGMAGRFPDAESLAEFWDLLTKGLDVHRQVPSDRYNVDTHTDPTGKRKNTSHTPYGCWIKHPGLFDAKFFNMSPKEAKQTDPMHRLALLTAYEALEMSGFVPGRTPSSQRDRVGTFYGQTSDDWREIQNGQDIQTYFIPGGVRAFAPGRINYHFGFTGPSFSVDTACSSSLAAINIACNSLWQGECDTALAGGLNVLTNPDIFAGLSRGQFLSKTGNCKTFDDFADGYCRGDGVGTVVIKRLEDAEADNDPILAVILGTGTNHSADAVSITHPHAENQQTLFKKSLTECGVNPSDISYVEMHGTGTQAGDAIEMQSVLGSYAPKSSPRPPHLPLYLGSVKANVGHGEAASGITSLAKILLMLENNRIPPHPGIKNKINSVFPDLTAMNVHICLGKEVPWNRPEGGKRRFVLNNFSAAGGNSTLIMEDGPLRITNGSNDLREIATVAVSAKTKTSFIQSVERLLDYLKQNPAVDLQSLSYTTTARRSHYQYRTIASGSTVSEIEDRLRKSLEGDPSPVDSKNTSTIFAFTGQGSHYSSMGKQLYQRIPSFKSDIQRFDLLARSQGFPSFIPLIDGSVPMEELSPVVVQTGAVCIQIALARFWENLGIKPSAVIGHSLGEYAALYAAGVLSVNDVIFLAATRATLLETHCTMNSHAMLAVSAATEDVEDCIDDSMFEVACINGPKATVISGQSDDVDDLKADLDSTKTKCTKLNVPFAFHSAQVDPILDEFEAKTACITFNKPKVPIISPLLGTVIQDEGTINSQYLRSHTRSTVHFSAALEAAKEAGTIQNNAMYIEIGCHPICSGLVKSVFGSTTPAVPSMRRDEDEWTTLAQSFCKLYMAGVEINWNYYHAHFPECLTTLRLPGYAWEAVNYWIDYQNDWTLTKGENPSNLNNLLPEKSTLSTSTVQRIVDENFQDETGSITTETDIQRPDLEETIRGHLVNGSALCSSAVYADMALTIGNYVHRKMDADNEDFTMNCSNMVVDKPLIARDPSKPQLLRTSTAVDMIRQTCTITFYSVDDKGNKTTEHARCQVMYGDKRTCSSTLSRQTYLIESQIDRLLNESHNGKLSQLSRKMAYKLFSVLVDYQDAYKGMDMVILDSPNHEGSAFIELKTSKEGHFFIAPYHIDSLCHLAGFIMNANDELDGSNTVFVNHGWESLEFSEKPEPNQTYRSYVRMQPKEPGSSDFQGDVYVFNGEGKIIGKIGGLEFQYMRKQILDRLLPPVGGAKQPAPTPAKAISGGKPKQTVPKSPPKQKAAEPTSNNFARCLDILADEIGVSTSELSDDAELASLGIDSLMSLTIASKLSEALEIEVSSTSIGECETIKDLKGFFEQIGGSNGRQNSTSSTGSLPDLEKYSTQGSSDDSRPITPPPVEIEALPVKDSDMTQLVRATIADETGMSESELTSAVELAQAGVDSLMSLQILGVLREEKGLDLPPTFFTDNETFGDVEKALGAGQENLEGKTRTNSEDEGKTRTNSEDEGKTRGKSEDEGKTRSQSKDKVKPDAQANKKLHKAFSIRLQGNPRTATQTLYLFPDGSGSPTSYANIGNVASNTLALIGLGCPFLKDAEAFDCGIQGVAALYVEEIQRRQPHGPYLLGGWSAGGIMAYEATLQLQAKGEIVDKLIYLDVPCPLPPQELPSHLHSFFDSIGLLGEEGDAPSWLIPHFRATIRALSSYWPRKMDPSSEHIPTTFMIYARDGVCKHDSDPRPELSDDDPEHMHWLLFNRTDFGPIGWEDMFGRSDKIVPLEPISGVNHFTMMREPGIGEISNRLRQAIELDS